MTKLRKTRTSLPTKRSRIYKYVRMHRSLPAYFSDVQKRSRESSNESQKLLIFPEASKEKWVALSLFCALAFTQSYVWNTWSPIAELAMAAYPSWTRGSISLLSDWGCISYLLFCFPCCWTLYKKGLPCPIRSAAFLATLATLVRCLLTEEFAFTIAAHVAAFLNGIVGVIVGSATALVSAVWFPPGQRTTATGISYAINQLGVAVSYLIGPAIIKGALHDGEKKINVNYDVEGHNTSKIAKSDDMDVNDKYILHQLELQNDIMSLMRIEFVIQLLLLIGTLRFYPERQPFQRISSTNYNDMTLFASILKLMRIKSIWFLCFAAALSHGTISPWLHTITIVFKSRITQLEADNLAFWTIILSCTLCLILSRIMDSFQGHLKMAINIMLALSAAMFIWVLLLDNHILTFQKKELYAAIMLGVGICWSTSALFLELASEMAFPISEAVVGGYMLFFINVVGSAFYLLQFIPQIDERWSTRCVLINLIIATILLFYVEDEYNRSKMDTLDSNFVMLYNNKSRFELAMSSSHSSFLKKNKTNIASTK